MGSAWEEYRETSSSRACSICTVIWLPLPISMIAMGAKYRDDCPAERYIPIYLIVAGCFACILVILTLVGNYNADKSRRRHPVIESIISCISLFIIAWFIAGNVWIYGLHGKYSTDPAAVNFCDNTLYLYAFWVTTVAYILIGVSMLLFGCFCCLINFMKDPLARPPDESRYMAGIREEPAT